MLNDFSIYAAAHHTRGKSEWLRCYQPLLVTFRHPLDKLYINNINPISVGSGSDGAATRNVDDMNYYYIHGKFRPFMMSAPTGVRNRCQR